MQQSNYYPYDMLDLDAPEARKDVVYRAGRARQLREQEGMIVLTVPFHVLKNDLIMFPVKEAPEKDYEVYVRAYGNEIVRVTVPFGKALRDDSTPMLEWDPTLKPEPLRLEKADEGYSILDRSGARRFFVRTIPYPRGTHEAQDQEHDNVFDAVVYPDGKAAVPFQAMDRFFVGIFDSMPIGFVEHEGSVNKVAFSCHAANDEHFAGTGERFSSMDLGGHTLMLENKDGLGTNSRRCYKNIPFYLSSKPYGLLVLTSAHLRLSLRDFSTRSAQGVIEDDILDLFFIGGGDPASIVRNYRRLTGFPHEMPPLWSFGAWMSKLTYSSAQETMDVADRLREGKYPCDVIHLDTGWFAKDWICDWSLSKERFPDPAGYFADMRTKGFRISLWQLPVLHKESALQKEAIEKGYACALRPDSDRTRLNLSGNFGGSDIGGGGGLHFDFSNPDAVRWYQALIANLLRMGASVIKADFGEEILMQADYANMDAAHLHNLYALLYQKAVYETTQEVRGEGIVWARAGWTGCQRYPLHWGGDTCSSWDGLASTIRGGLHLGVSGFSFWSHDTPGFIVLPDRVASWPQKDLYLRWLQVGVFTSHLRFHGILPREPYRFPEACDDVRKWLNLRYALIPYIIDEGKKSIIGGRPIFRALLFDHPDDPFCWQIDDQYYFGDSFLVAPVMNSENIRNIYLPEGEWVDVFTGDVLKGGCLLKKIEVPLDRMPVFAKKGACIRVYPDVVQSTNEMDLEKAVELRFDGTYRGIANSVLGKVSGLT
jgi:alpha-D-xyloside xylohydrolase